MSDAPVVILLVSCLMGGCATQPSPWSLAQRVQTVDMPVPVLCQIDAPAKPEFSADTLKLGSDIFTQTKALLADREQRMGYEGELEAAIEMCQ